MNKKSLTFETPFETYKSTGVIGEGGAGRVYAVINSAGETFALKCLAAERITTEKLKRFKNEIEFCQRHTHSNIVSVIDTGITLVKDIKCPFYVMHKYEGTLRSLMDNDVDPEKALELFSKLLDGIEAAHLVSVWHRDLKPENILLGKRSSELVIADFGIAHFEEEEIYTAVETKVIARMANFRYSAPEQRERNAPVDHRADLFALGLILNELYTGEVLQGAGYKRISEVHANYEYLDDIVESMIQQNPENRPDSIEAIKKLLIGKKNAFVALQEYDKTKDRVIPVAEATEFDPVTLVGLDYSGSTLHLKLSRNVPPGWIQEFQNPRSGYSSIVGYDPTAFHIGGNSATIGVRDNEEFVQRLVNNFKQYLKSANRGYELQLQEQSRQEEQRMKAQLEKETAEAELRKNILSKVKF